MSLALIASLPFVAALTPALTQRFGRKIATLIVAAFTASALALILQHLPAIMAGEVVTTQINWLPNLGLNANFRLDGLTLLFALLILGIGLLIQTYACFYLDKSEPYARFLIYLMLFQGAMLGIILSDNILLLLVFWELTSLSSFLLIGFWSHLPQARQGARMALATTGAGGLAMIAGMMILGDIADSYDISTILTQKAAIQASPLYLPALILILLGAFTKSAQFPFHFWLPHAMAAPTPVSAYLHSATMVKAGLFLLARLWPVLSGTPEWFWIVTSAGLITMAFAAKVALFKDDLKAILAYSTVSHLGLITFLFGLGTKAAATAAIFHILCHATFKAALFMLAGIVDHATHTRDIKHLGGLRRAMPITFALASITSLSMAGIPPLNGFLSKEMMLEEAAHSAPWIIPLLATLAALLSVAYSLRFLSYTFLGAAPAYAHAPHDPGPGLWAPPALLAALVVAIGLAPMPMAAWLVDAAASATTAQPVHAHIALWHGLTSPALWMSLAAVGGGLAALGLYPALRRIWDASPKPQAKPIFDNCLSALTKIAQGITAVHNGSLSRGFVLALLSVLGLGLYAFQTAPHLPGSRALTPIALAPATGFALLMAATLAATILHRQRLLALLLVGIVGLILSASFAYLSAPDLALTQITVEVVTVALMLLCLNFLPKTSPRETVALRKIRDGAIAASLGIATAALAYALMLRDAVFPPISAFHLAQSLPGAGGHNAVNTIIVDFRGYDTYGEIIVLGIAALLIFALTESLLASKWAVGPDHVTGDAGDPHPIMLQTATRLILPMAMLVGTYLFLRGHNAPGGGFVAGLVFAIGLVMQYIASGQDWAAARRRIPFHAMIGAGVLIASATGIGSFIAGRPFLTSNYTHVHLPPFEDFELATAALFDLGVFLCVFGAVMLALDALARLAKSNAQAQRTETT
ncbi:monovalent cation/H+ antiporter subunit A [Cypionkella aquatica]|uniref:Monovalent cation/H+ antiporter subunit A n=1 Tax=Cypionkella aquatica TaxID=1756042 RepID=A0AA37WZ12_9RHOB|nr:monovalent cation/H+ antiporter subunit A [Cypionkella aquatica]GLS85788.1 monovalent cation/H+ antiporter subunit A [Cypionkella aquatica]